nr:serine/threonine protein kinase [Deltaproteobacteria bacterium]
MSGASQSPVVGLGATLSSAVGDGEETDRAADAWAVADDAVLAAVKAAVLGEAHTPVRLGKYEVERPLGAGAMGRILLARDPQLDRLVALKIIAPQLADVPEARRRIVREARAMARLSDPNVAQVYEVAEEGPHLFVAMEYVDGQRLGQWLAERARPWAKIVDVLVQAGRGLAAVHAKGLVHRDFKPDNVMLERGGRAKVVDFGLASGSTDFGGLPLSEAGTMESLDANLTATGAWLGTPAYMAPEQWEGSRVDARSDQFSFCVAVYEALAGQRPFGGDTAAQMRHAVLEQRPAPLRGKVRVPRRVEAAILRGLDIDPLQRWPAMEPLLRALSPRARTKTAVIVPMVALGLTAALLSRTGDDACANADAPMDQTWSPAVRDELRSTMEAVPVPWAGPTAVAVAGHLDRASEAWRQASQAVCAAEDAPAEASACLEHHRRRLATTIARLRASGPAGLVSAVSHLELLADARACLQPSATGWIRDHDSDDAVVVSADPEHGESETIARLGLLSIAAGAHGYAETLAQGRDAAARNLAGAQARGDRPAVAYGAWLLGRVALRDGDRGAAEAAFRRAMDVAMEVGETSLRAAATVELVYVVGNDRERTVEAITLANEAESMLSAQGDLPVWTARLAAHRAS